MHFGGSTDNAFEGDGTGRGLTRTRGKGRQWGCGDQMNVLEGPVQELRRADVTSIREGIQQDLSTARTWKGEGRGEENALLHRLCS